MTEKNFVWPKMSRMCLFFVVYIDDLVITNCLIDARVFVHALPHILFAILLCEHVGRMIFLHSRTSICCFDCLVFRFAKWMNTNA